MPHEKGKISVGVKNVKVHDDWNTKTDSYDADIAILTLAENVQFTRYIQPICLIDHYSSLINIQKGYAVGYGTSEDKTKIHENILKCIEIPFDNNNENCFYSRHSLVNLSSNRTFCGGNRDGTGVCSGDSGNGLFVVHNS